MEKCARSQLWITIVGLCVATPVFGDPSLKPVRPTYDTAPNPQLIPDEIIPLDHSKWNFAIGDGRPFDHKINFGFAPESDLSGVDYEELRNPNSSKDVVWYRRKVVIPSDWKGAVLTFEGVDHTSDVYVNGKHIAQHVGGYAPFSVDLKDVMNSGKRVPGGIEHEIMVRAEDDRLARDIAVGKQERRPNEGVIFYDNMTGAWKGAHLRRVDNDYISNVKHVADADGTLRSTIYVKGSTPDLHVKAIVIDRTTGKTVGISQSIVQNGKAAVEIHVTDPKLWHPDNPNLYDVKLDLLGHDKPVESMRSYVGFRSFEQKNSFFMLNHKPTLLRGVLNQMVFPKGLYTPDTPQDNAKDIRAIREHGFNFQRVHNTTPRWRDIYEMENGVLVKDPKTGKIKRMGVGWALEMPSARDLRNPNARDRFMKEWGEIIDAYGNGHPGLFYYVAGNEDWGMLEDEEHWAPASDAQREKFQRELLRTTLNHAPEGSLVSTNDGWRQITGTKYGRPVPGVNANQLILSAHDYRPTGEGLVRGYGSIPVNAKKGTPLPRNAKPLLLPGFESPGKDAAFVIGEFGGKSYASPENKNVFGYGMVYTDLGEWERDSLGQVAALGKTPYVKGYVHTQVRDAGNKPHRAQRPGEPGGELNGFLFADGRPKGNPADWAQVNLENQKAFDERVLKLGSSISRCLMENLQRRSR